MVVKLPPPTKEVRFSKKAVFPLCNIGCTLLKTWLPTCTCTSKPWAWGRWCTLLFNGQEVHLYVGKFDLKNYVMGSKFQSTRLNFFCEVTRSIRKRPSWRVMMLKTLSLVSCCLYSTPYIRELSIVHSVCIFKHFFPESANKYRYWGNQSKKCVCRDPSKPHVKLKEAVSFHAKQLRSLSAKNVFLHTLL